MEEPLLYLASNSPRRRQILALAGWSFQVSPANVDESPRPGETPAAYVQRLSIEKAHAAAAAIPPVPGGQPGCIIAADTTVSDGDQILGKPADPADARAMLESLRGRTHQALTGLTVYVPASGALRSEICTTYVTMRDFNDTEMDAYIATGDPLDKAGAYAIQHSGFHPVARLEGCYANVMGLPVCLLEQMLAQAGISARLGLPTCPSDSAVCPFCQVLMRGADEN